MDVPGGTQETKGAHMKCDVYLIRNRGGCRYRVRHPVRILLLAFSLVSLIRTWHFLREEHASFVYTGGESGARLDWRAGVAGACRNQGMNNVDELCEVVSANSSDCRRGMCLRSLGLGCSGQERERRLGVFTEFDVAPAEMPPESEQQHLERR